MENISIMYFVLLLLPFGARIEGLLLLCRGTCLAAYEPLAWNKSYPNHYFSEFSGLPLPPFSKLLLASSTMNKERIMLSLFISFKVPEHLSLHPFSSGGPLNRPTFHSSHALSLFRSPPASFSWPLPIRKGEWKKITDEKRRGIESGCNNDPVGERIAYIFKSKHAVTTLSPLHLRSGQTIAVLTNTH